MYDLIIGISYLVSGFFLTKSNETIGYSLMVAGIIMDSKYTYNAYFHNNKQLLLLTSAINIGICFYIAVHTGVTLLLPRLARIGFRSASGYIKPYSCQTPLHDA